MCTFIFVVSYLILYCVYQQAHRTTLARRLVVNNNNNFFFFKENSKTMDFSDDKAALGKLRKRFYVRDLIKQFGF